MSYRRRASGENKRPRNVTTAMTKFLEWNMWGKGEVKLSSRGSAFWYRDDVFYRGWNPTARCLHAAGHGVVLFKRYDQGCGLYRGYARDLIPDERIINVDDICVWGPGQGQGLGTNAFLEAVRQQLIGKAVFLLDEADGLSHTRCWSWVEASKKPPLVGSKGTTYYSHDYAIDGRTKMIERCGEQYRNISDLFKLDWPEVPWAEMGFQYLEIVRAKAATYERNTPKRERAQLRKEGVEALGINEELAA